VTGATGSGVLVTGDVGSSPTPSISNFPPSSTVPPFIVRTLNDAVVQQARMDAIAAYNAMAAQGPGTVLPDNLATVGVLGPGIYSFASGAPDLPASATLTLNGGGIFIFNVGSSLTANVMSNVTGTANPCNIFWRVGSSATLNGNTFRGTVVATSAITVGSGATLTGRALAGMGATGAVTMAGSGGNTIGGCAVPPPGCPPIILSPSTLPNGTVGAVYSQAMTGSGGVAPYTFTVTSGTLPAGLTLTTAGVVSGTPTTPSSSTVTIRGTDANGCFASITVTIVIGPAQPPGCPVVTITPPTLPSATLGLAYSQTLTLTGGTAPATFVVTSGTLPAGLTLTPAGILAGTPTTMGSSAVVVRGTDANGCFAEIPYTVVVLGPVPTLAQGLVVVLGLGLMSLGYLRLRSRARAS